MHSKGTVETTAVKVSGFEPSVAVMLVVVVEVVTGVVTVVVLGGGVVVMLVSSIPCDSKESNRNVVTIMQ